MLLQKIKTRGFLGHRGAADSENGSPDYVELDFTDTSLSLVHGANGAGKSTFWDALLFSFFKEHRGGGSNFVRLIHDCADDAEIVVEFLLDDGLTYEIYSKISKRGKGANVTRSVWLVNGKNRKTRGESDAAVEDWINKNLQMSAQTFTSAVLLRQGEADAFLKAKPTKRREILLELLQLDFYRELGTQATKRKTNRKNVSDRLSDELANLSNPTNAEIEDQRVSIETAKTQIESLSKIKESKNEELSNAKRSASLQNDIAETEKQQKADAQFLDATRAAEIRKKYERFCELEKVLMRLEKLWEAKDELSGEEEKLRTSELEIAKLEKELEKLTEYLAEAAKTSASAQTGFAAAEITLQKAIAERDAAQKKFEQLKEIEKLETAISNEEIKLAPHNSVLSKREEIWENFARFQELENGLELLRTLQKAEENLRHAEADLKKLKDEFEEKKWLGDEAQKKIENFKAELKAKESDERRFRTEINECEKSAERRKAKIENRNMTTGEVECPTCGTMLDEHAAHRIADELEKAKAEIAELDAKKGELENTLRESEKESAAISVEKEKAEKQLQEIQNDLSRTDENLKRDELDTKKCRVHFADAQAKAGDWASKDFAGLESEFSALADSPTERERLEAALNIEGNVNAVIGNLCGQLKDCPLFDENKREEIRQSIEIFEEKVESCETAQMAAQTKSEVAKRAERELETQKTERTISLKNKNESRADLQTRCVSAREKVEKAQSEIPTDNAEFQAAGKEKDKFESLSVEKNDLQYVEAENRNLTAADERKTELETKVRAYQGDLNKIPLEHRRLVGEVETEIAQVAADTKQKGESLRTSENDLREMENQQKSYEAKKAESDAANKDLRLWKKLAEAFGKKGLEARIVQTAQETVKNNANKILGALCDSFQIKLEESASGEELEIYVHDSNTQNADEKGRHFEYFSGGESLLIAVSLAVAIGQAVTGKNAANTLIIDEGFGALDNSRREILVEELKRLSEEVLQNGRIIVVSHQDNVKEKFSHRYHLEKDDKGFVKVGVDANI